MAHAVISLHGGLSCETAFSQVWCESYSLVFSLSTISQPMDQSSLKNSDVLILTGLTQMPTANPDGMLGDFCSNLGGCYI